MIPRAKPRMQEASNPISCPQHPLQPVNQLTAELDQSKYQSEVEKVGSSILGEWELYYLMSKGPVKHWIDWLAIKYCRYVGPPCKEILFHPFDQCLYMKVEAVYLWIWAEELVSFFGTPLDEFDCSFFISLCRPRVVLV